MDQEKLEDARAVIRTALETGTAPVVLTSFGKDSVVLLALVREQVPTVPCLWFRYDFKGQHRRHKFAHDLIMQWGLKVFDYQPMLRVPLSDGENDLELAQLYSTGGDGFLTILIGTDGQYGECVLDIGNSKTIPKWDYPWDITFSGERAEESDPILGLRDLPEDGAARGNTRLFYPLRHWTLSEIWAYTMEQQLPVNSDRYLRGDSESDGDQYSICSRCINPISEVSESGVVHCPKENKLIKYRNDFTDWKAVLEEMKENLNATSGN